MYVPSETMIGMVIVQNRVLGCTTHSARSCEQNIRYKVVVQAEYVMPQGMVYGAVQHCIQCFTRAIDMVLCNQDDELSYL